MLREFITTCRQSSRRKLYKAIALLVLLGFTIFFLICPWCLICPCQQVITPTIVLVVTNKSTTVNRSVQDHSDEVTIATLTGEERAAAVWERCRSSTRPLPCVCRGKPIEKRLLPVPSKRFVLCTLGKTGTSNWKTLILQLNDVITGDEARNMTYPHSKRLWINDGTLFFIIENKNKVLEEEVKTEYYRITFVRDPLSRLLSAYRDKFTGDSTQYEFRVYRNHWSRLMCAALQVVVEDKPDGDMVPDQIYSYISSEISQHCLGYHNHFVSLGIFWTFLIFTPQTLNKDLNPIMINAHFTNMLSLCQHCKQKFDFIGTLETMTEDVEFLKRKFDITYDLPNISSTQEGAAGVEEVRAMWENLPELLKQYAILYMQDDARIFGYPGYETYLNRTLYYPNHNEKQIMCKS